MKLGYWLLGAITFLYMPHAYAQVESNFSAGGGVRIGYSTTICDSSISGAIRYNSAAGGSVDFCNGTSWLNVGSNGSIDSLSDAYTDYVTDHNLFMGLNAGTGIQTGGQYNLFIGATAGAATTTGYNNIAVGHNALGTNITGSNNVAIGRDALWNRTGRSNNIGIGHSAGSHLQGDNSIAIGVNSAAGSGGAGGDHTVAIGNNSLRNVGGDRNVAVGYNAMTDGAATGSSDNVAIGYGAMTGVASGSAVTRNVAIGYQAGEGLNGGSNNVLVGYQAGNNISSGGGNILIGASVSAAAATDNNKLNIGNLIYGDLSASKYVGINQPVPAYTLHVNGDIAYTGVMIDVSDRRRKDDIKPLPSALDNIMKLRPVTFVMKGDTEKSVEYGFIAQDVQQVYPALVKMASDADQSLSLNYLGLLAPLLKAMQEQQSIMDDQKKQIDELTLMLEKVSSDE